LAIALAGAVALAACGGGSSSGLASKSPEQIVSAAVSAMKHAKSVHVYGTVTTGGKTIGLDLHIATGKGETGTFTLGGNPVTLTEIGTTTYLKVSTGFAKQYAGAAAALIANRWLRANANNALTAGLSNFTNINTQLGKVLAKAHAGDVARGGTSTIGGTQVVAVTNSKAGGGTLYVATKGTPYPVQLSAKQGAIHFDSWNATVTLTAPSGAIDISKLAG
jgi:hypothetical protein